jgi:hypothetical protein
MFVPLYLLLFFILAPLLFLNEIDLTQLQPSLAGGWSKPYESGILGMGAFGDIILLGAFMNNVKDPRALYVSLRSGIILSAGIMTMWTLLIITVISPTTASRIIYIGWILVQQIHITDFLDRVDLVVFSTWLPLFLVKMMILYLSILTGLATYTKDNSYKQLNMMTGLFLILLSTVCFKNVMEVVTFNNYGIFPFTFAVQVIYFSVLFAVLWLRRRGKQELRESNTPIGHALWLGLAGCFAAIVFGNFFGHFRGFYGIISVGCYILFLFLTVIFALNELRRVQMRSVKQ